MAWELRFDQDSAALTSLKLALAVELDLELASREELLLWCLLEWEWMMLEIGRE